MDSAIHAALVSGALSGAVVLAGIGLQQHLTVRRDQRGRRQALVAQVLGDYLAAIAENARAGKSGDTSIIFRSGARILAAQGQLAVFGTPQIMDALVAFEATGKHMGAREAKDALVNILRTIRSEVLPREQQINAVVLASLLFEAPPAEGGLPQGGPNQTG